MPFGKHKGKPLSAVPRGYLQWLYRQDFVRQPLKGRIERVLFGIPEPTEDQIIDAAIARCIRSLDEQLGEGAG